MRQFLYLLLFPLLSLCQQTYVPDDNFEQALIEFNIDPNPILDDSVPTSIINSIAYIDISNREITDLTGIEDFAYLASLICNNNNLSEIDISNNTMLTELTCSFNYLIDLNISNNLELVRLACSDNIIETLDISNNTSLEYVDCHANNLSEIDVSNNLELHLLNCAFNNLNEIDLSNNVVLDNFSVEANNLSDLNISNNPLLNYLDCSFNNLIQLNLINNSNLNFMFCNDNNLSCVEVWSLNEVNYLEMICNAGSVGCFRKDEFCSWSLDCNYESSIYENLTSNPLTRSFNILGKDAANTDFIFQIHKDGSVKKYFHF